MAHTVAAPVQTTIVGVFDNLNDVRAAIENLRRDGFGDDQIGFIGPEHRGSPHPFESHLKEHIEEGTEIGATVGAVAGGAAGLAVLAGLFPPIGPALAGGALIAWLASVGVGTASGAVVGSLVGLGLPEDDARWYESELLGGRTLLTVQDVNHRAEEVREIMREHGGVIREPNETFGYGTGLEATPY